MTKEKKKNVASWFIETLWNSRKPKLKERTRKNNKAYYFTVRQHKTENEKAYKVFSRSFSEAGRSAVEHFNQHFKKNTVYLPYYHEIKDKKLPDFDVILVNRYNQSGVFTNWSRLSDEGSPIVDIEDLPEIMLYLERMEDMDEIITSKERALASRFLIGLKVIMLLYEKNGLTEQGIKEACDIMSKIVKRYDDLKLTY